MVYGVVTRFLNITGIEGFPRDLAWTLIVLIIVNDIKPVIPQTLLSKYPDDITASVSVTISHNRTDSSHEEVVNVKRWADDNQLKVEVVVKGKTRLPLPKSLDGIARKSELKLLRVAINEDPCNWNTQLKNILSKASSRLYILSVCKCYDDSLQEHTLPMRLRSGLVPTMVNIFPKLTEFASGLYVMVIAANIHPQLT